MTLNFILPSQDTSSLREIVVITTFLNRGLSFSCLLKYHHPPTFTPSTTFNSELLKIAGLCQRKFFLSFQSFAFCADADAVPTPVEPKPANQDFLTFTSESKALSSNRGSDFRCNYHVILTFHTILASFNSHHRRRCPNPERWDIDNPSRYR